MGVAPPPQRHHISRTKYPGLQAPEYTCSPGQSPSPQFTHLVGLENFRNRPTLNNIRTLSEKLSGKLAQKKTRSKLYNLPSQHLQADRSGLKLQALCWSHPAASTFPSRFQRRRPPWGHPLRLPAKLGKKEPAGGNGSKTKEQLHRTRYTFIKRTREYNKSTFKGKFNHGTKANSPWQTLRRHLQDQAEPWCHCHHARIRSLFPPAPGKTHLM